MYVSAIFCTYMQTLIDYIMYMYNPMRIEIVKVSSSRMDMMTDITYYLFFDMHV